MTIPHFRPRHWNPLATIFVVALVLRLAVITAGHTYRITPRGDHFQFGWEMGRVARSIATGQGFSSPTDLHTGPTAMVPPVYPYLLAVVFKLCGVYSYLSAWVILAINSVFDSLICLTLYCIAERIYDRNLARAVAWTWALFPYAVYWPVRVVWETSLSALLLSAAIVLTLRLAEKPLLQRWLTFGALWGLTALTNTALLSLLPCCLAWLLYHLPRESRRILGAALCLLTAALVITPWLVRNYESFGEFIFIRNNLPLELHLANNENSGGLWTRTESPSNDPHAMTRFQQLGELAFMHAQRQEVQEFVGRHPGRFLRFTSWRAIYFWIGTPQNAVLRGHDFLIFRHASYLFASALAFGGCWLTIRNRREGAFLLSCCLLLYPLPYYLVMPAPRYKHAIEPEMMLLIVYLLSEIRRRSTQNKSQEQK